MKLCGSLGSSQSFLKILGQPQSRSSPNREHSLGLQHMSYGLGVVPGGYFYNLQFCFGDQGLKLATDLDETNLQVSAEIWKQVI